MSESTFLRWFLTSFWRSFSRLFREKNETKTDANFGGEKSDLRKEKSRLLEPAGGEKQQFELMIRSIS